MSARYKYKLKNSNAPFFNFVHNVGYLKYFFETSGTVLVQPKKTFDDGNTSET